MRRIRRKPFSRLSGFVFAAYGGQAKGKIINDRSGGKKGVDETQRRLLDSLREKIGELALAMEKMKLAEYVELLGRPGRLFYVNFLSGLARGFGMAVGFALLGAVIVIVLQRMVALNLPLIGGFIAEIVSIVQTQLER